MFRPHLQVLPLQPLLQSAPLLTCPPPPHSRSRAVVRTPSKYADSLGSRKGVELVAGDVSDPQVQGPAPLAAALPSARLAGGAAAHAAPLAW